MPRIRIPQEHWGEVWMALVGVGSVSLISEEPVYIVSKRHIEVLKEKHLPFELLNSTYKLVGGNVAQAGEKI
ncbi:hypothetical protein FJZ31_19390 [Candidatus Poribacteria bacterium]|nr:hypothetical protein [Candidatus Poribacteria bacterium]